jgi:hypothetical protein
MAPADSTLEKSPAVLAAEAKLLGLERFGHAVDEARTELQYANARGKAPLSEDAKAQLAAALSAQADAGIVQVDVDAAAQELLEARGEGHTETGILPPDFGIRTVQAENAFADAHREGTAAMVATSAALDEARAADHADKLAHVEESNTAAIAAINAGEPANA